MAEIPALRTDGWNWSAWRANLERTVNKLGVRAYISKTTPNPYNEQANTLAKCAIASTIPDSLFLRILRFKSAYECFETLRTLFEKNTATIQLQYELWSDRTKQEATYGLETANDHARRRTEVRDTSRRDDDVSHRSARREVHVPHSNTRRQRQREPRSQGRVERGRGEGEEGSKLNGRDDKKVTVVVRLGRRAMDQKVDHVSLVKPTSRERDSPKTHVDTPSPSPSPPTPTLPAEQPAPTSKRPADQRSRNSHVPRNGTRRTCKDIEGSQGGVKSSSRRDREADDEDSDDIDVHHGHVEPHPPSSTRQTANEEATGTSNPYANGAGTTTPVGTTNEPSNDIDEGKSRSRGSQEVDDDIHHAHAVPQGPHQTHQTAVEEAADTVNPNVKDVRSTMPVGTSNGWHDELSEESKRGKGERNERASGIVDPSLNGKNAIPDLIPPAPNSDEQSESNGDSKGEKAERDERASGDVAPSSNGENAVPDLTPPPPYHIEPPPHERSPPSMPLEGEKGGKQSSSHIDETGTHLETPRHESRTTPPERTPYDHRSNREGRRMAIGHRQAVGEEDKVGEGNDGWETSYGDNERRRRKEEAKDEASRDDEEGLETREVEGTPNEGKERTTVTNVNEDGQLVTNDKDNSPSPPLPPNHPPAPAPAPIHPEQPDDVDTAKLNKTPARRRADALHNPGGETTTSDSTPPSVRLEGESSKQASRHVEVNDVEMDSDHVEVNDVEMDSDHVEDDPDNQPTPENPVGTQDGDERRPNEPTEPSDEEEGAQRRNSEMKVNRRVETVEEVETGESSRVDQPGGRGGNEDESREVEGETGGQSEDNGCQRDGRTNDTGRPTSGTSPKRPTYHVNPPRRQG